MGWHWDEVFQVSYILLVLECLCVAAIVLLIYNRFGSIRERPVYVTVSVTFAWFFSFSLVFLVPIDIASTAEEECKTQGGECPKPFLYLPYNARATLWLILYWTTYVATWVVYPVLQSYSCAGDFTFFRKLWASVKENLIFYGICAVFCGVACIYLVIAASLDFKGLIGVAIMLGNTWGLFLLIFLLGNGLVEIPRTIWRRSNRMMRFKLKLFEVAAFHTKLDEAKLDYMKNIGKVKGLDEKLAPLDPMRWKLKVIQDKIPAEEWAESKVDRAVHPHDYDNKLLVNLHLAVRETKHTYRQTKALYENRLGEVMRIEDIINSQGSLARQIHWTTERPLPSSMPVVNNVYWWLEYWWETTLFAKVMVLCWLFCVTFSALIVWSEGTFFIDVVNLSFFSWLVNLTVHSDVLLQLTTFVPLAYISVCAYFALFRLRIFNYYRLIGHQQTDSRSLLFSAAYICRLSAPMVYNFLFLIKNDKTAFVKVMGDITVVPIFGGKGFNSYFPIILILICLANLFDLYSRILSCLNVTTFNFSEDFDHKLIDEGKKILVQERRKRATPQRMEFAHSDESPLMRKTDYNDDMNDNKGFFSSIWGTTPKPAPKYNPDLEYL